MSAVSIMLVLAVLLLAYVNGANDNFKGVATLFGSGTAGYYRALCWATAATFAGSLVALTFAERLVETFQGKALVPDTFITSPNFYLAVSLGAALTVLLATWLGLPVATTHAVIGGLIGAGWQAAGEIHLETLGLTFALPLLLSPVAAMLLTVILYRLVCMLKILRENDQYEVRPILNGLHYLSAGAVSFARGMSATSKIMALVLVEQALSPVLAVALVASAMAVGGVVSAWPVADTLSRKITRMNSLQGLIANAVTATLAIAASCLGLPASTTHVAVGALFGIGLVTDTANAKSIRRILLAWITTVPLSAIFAAAIYALA
jgi:PiT family inorganic phosphate transporter